MGDSKWGVWCEVSGGVTGHREAWLKAADGRPLAFSTEEEAIAKAADQKRGIGAIGPARFRYTARRLREA